MSTRRAPESWQRNVWALALCVFIAFVGFQFVPAGQLLLGQLLVGGAFCALMAMAERRFPLLLLRTVAARCLGGTLTLAYTLGGLIVPAATRGAAFG